MSHPLPSLGLPVAVSVGGHLALGLLIVLVPWLMPSAPPMIDPRHVMEVSMVVLPKSATRLPDRASKVAVVRGDLPTAEIPPPVRESDLVIHEPDAPTQGRKDRDLDPDQIKKVDTDALLRQLDLQALLAEAPDGPVDRLQTDPDGTTDESITTLGRGTIGDPEWARYQQQLQQLFMAGFSPLPTIAQQNPSISCIVSVEVDGEGTVTDWGMHTPSGNLSYDAAAERAVGAVPTIPLPPPRFLHLLQDGFEVRFVPPRR